MIKLGFWGKLFGTDAALKHGAEAAHEATGAIINGIDASFYTKEETVNDIKEILFKLQDQFIPRSISRRMIAIIFTLMFCLFAVTALVFACFGAGEVVAAIISVAAAFRLGIIMLTIFFFYFGYYGTQKILADKKSQS